MAPEAIQGRARGFEAACDWCPAPPLGQTLSPSLSPALAFGLPNPELDPLTLTLQPDP